MIQKKGTLTVEFLFSFTALVLLSLYFFYVAFSLSLMEVAQYVTYAAAREYTLGQEENEGNEVNAKEKYRKLAEEKFFKSAMSAWIKISPSDSIEFPDNEGNEGVKTKFTSCIMALNIPFLGDTITDTSSNCNGGPAFTTNISSYLGPPAPSQKNCEKFLNIERWTFLSGHYGNAPGLPQGELNINALGNGC